MIKSKALNELNAVIETKNYVQKINRQAHDDLGYDLNTIYMLLHLQQTPFGVDLTDFGKELSMSASTLSLRISSNVRLGLMRVENVAQDRRTKRVYY